MLVYGQGSVRDNGIYDEIRGLVLLYPAFVMADRINGMFRSPDEIPPQAFFLLWMTVGRAYAEALLGRDLYDDIAPYRSDVLIIHGTADAIVPYSYSEKAADIYESAELHLIDGAGHGFYGDDFDYAVSLISTYFRTHLKEK